MPRQPTLSRRPRDHNAHGWTLLERAERSSSDEGEAPLSQHQRLVRQNKAIKFFRRIGLKILYATKLCAMYRNLLRWELQAQLETEEQRASMPQAPPSRQSRYSRLARRDDLTYVGRALRPSRSQRGFPNLPANCNHQNHLVAGGGMSANRVKLYFWTCMGCGNRWERVSASHATNGQGANTTEPSRTRGPLRPQTAPDPAQAASSAGRTQRARSPSASEAPTDVPHHQMDTEDEESEIEIIPTLPESGSL